MTEAELKTLIKCNLFKIEIELQNSTGKYVSVGNETITDILMEVYGNDILNTFKTFYKEDIKE